MANINKTASSSANEKIEGLDLLATAKAEIEAGNIEVLDASKALVRKLDLYLMPLIFGTWIFQSLDKSTLGSASLFGLRQETHLVGTDYSWLGSLFFVGWMVWEYPCSRLLQHFPVAKVLSITVMFWGLLLMCHAACKSFAGLAVVRTLLGALESACNPAMTIIFGMYYTRSEQPFRMGSWVGFGGIAYILNGIISYGIGHAHAKISTWRLIYLIYGAISTLWGGLLWVMLPDNPLHARFLSEEERKAVIIRINENGTGIENKTFKRSQFIEALTDIKSWLFFLISLTINFPNGVFINFQGIIIQDMGFTGLKTTLMTMPSGAMQLISCVLASYLATRFKNLRIAMSLVFILPLLAGLIGLHFIPESNPYPRIVCIWLCWFFPAPYGIAMALINANTAGHTKRTTTNAIFIIGAGAGSFMGPFFFKSNQEPSYSLGFYSCFVAWGIEVLALVGLFVVLWMRNKEKRVVRGGEAVDIWAVGENGFLDMTDIENVYFEYVY